MSNFIPIGPRVVSVKPEKDFLLIVEFNNGEQRLFDAKPLFKYPVFKQLEDKSFFSLVKVDHGTVMWPCDIDYCPDTLYAESKPM